MNYRNFGESWPERMFRPRIYDISVIGWRRAGPEATLVSTSSRNFGESWPEDGPGQESAINRRRPAKLPHYTETHGLVGAA